MFLFHNGIVRRISRKQARENLEEKPVRGMRISVKKDRVLEAEERTRALPGITHVRTWLNEGEVSVGDSIMLVLVGGDIRTRVMEGLSYLIGELKTKCIEEEELFEP